MTEIYRFYQGSTKLPTETYQYNYQLIALSEERWEKVLTNHAMADAKVDVVDLHEREL